MWLKNRIMSFNPGQHKSAGAWGRRMGVERKKVIMPKPGLVLSPAPPPTMVSLFCTNDTTIHAAGQDPLPS